MYQKIWLAFFSVTLFIITPGGCTAQTVVIGDEEIVFDWTEDRCTNNTLPDLPVRAFRNGEGLIQLNLSSPHNLRLLGPDFDSLEPDCDQLILGSDVDPIPLITAFKSG